MTSPTLRRVGALALASLLAGWAAGRADAAGISTTSAPTSYKYSLVGSVDAPSANTPSLVYYNGTSSGTVTPPDSIDLGQFVVSSLAKTTNATYSNTPFQFIASVGGDAAEKISGVINGSVGPNATNPGLTYTFTSVSQYGNNPLPFGLNLPLNTPMPIAMTDGTLPAATGINAPTVMPAAVPEPASIAVFAVALGGLGLWRRRAARAA